MDLFKSISILPYLGKGRGPEMSALFKRLTAVPDARKLQSFD